MAMKPKEKCAALNHNGRRCSRPATHQSYYHGDSELYTGWKGKPMWVRVWFCEKHRVVAILRAGHRSFRKG